MSKKLRNTPDREPAPSALPRVSQETLNKLIGDMDENPNFRKDALGRIGQENPLVAHFVVEALTLTDDPETEGAIMTVAALMYESLRSQAEADRMNGQFD